MTTDTHAPTQLTDDELLNEVRVLAHRERRATVHLIAALTELDTRRLYLGQGYSSLFTYCTHGLHLSESAAYSRIEAARAARRFPIILEMLTNGALTLTSVCLLAKHLTPANHRAVLDAARYSTKREVEAQVAALQPLPPVLAFVRRQPVPLPVVHGESLFSAPSPDRQPSSDRADALFNKPVLRESLAKSRPASRLSPLSPDCYKVQFTISRATHDKLREAQNLMRHVDPSGDLTVIVDRALTLLVENLRKRRWAQAERPHPTQHSSPRSRHVPASVKRDVWRRDGGRCAFIGAAGRCSERGLLELHHMVPFADGGLTTTANLELRCRAHNLYEAQQYFGEWLTG